MPGSKGLGPFCKMKKRNSVIAVRNPKSIKPRFSNKKSKRLEASSTKNPSIPIIPLQKFENSRNPWFYTPPKKKADSSQASPIPNPLNSQKKRRKKRKTNPVRARHAVQEGLETLRAENRLSRNRSALPATFLLRPVANIQPRHTPSTAAQLFTNDRKWLSIDNLASTTRFRHPPFC